MPATTRSGTGDSRASRCDDRAVKRDLALLAKKKTVGKERRIMPRAPKHAFQLKKHKCSAVDCTKPSLRHGSFVNLHPYPSEKEFGKVRGWCGSPACERVVVLGSGRGYVATTRSPSSMKELVVAKPEDFEPNLTLAAALRKRVEAVQREEDKLTDFVGRYTKSAPVDEYKGLKHPDLFGYYEEVYHTGYTTPSYTPTDGRADDIIPADYSPWTNNVAGYESED